MQSIEHILTDPIVREWHRTGSRYICRPSPEDTDDDIVVLVSDLYLFAKKIEAEEQFASVDASEMLDQSGCDSNFISLRRGESNLILTADRPWYDKFVLATKAARRLNLLEKGDRVALFQIVLYGNEG